MAAPIFFIATDSPRADYARDLIESLNGFGPGSDLISPGAQPRACTAGPGGKAGYTLPGPGEAWHAGYYPERQSWRKVEGLTFIDEPGAELWIGLSVEPGKEPTPADFARGDDVIPGHLITLGDDHRWLIPICRKFGRVNALPTRMRFDHAAGRWVDGEMLDRYVRLSHDAERWYTHIFAGAEEGDRQRSGETSILFPFADAAEIACRALAVNYRLNPTLVDRLGLLTQHNLVAILNAMIDMDGILSLARKEQAAREGRPFADPTPNGSNTSSGGTGATPTAPVAR